MLKRLIVGLLIGIVIGGAAGYGLLQVWPAAMAGALGYAFAAVVAVIVGLVAGKPIWAKGAAIEAGLKATIGAALACGILFGIRFIPLSIPAMFGIPAGELGRHAIASLLSVATLLSVFYELDNTDEPEQEGKAGEPKKRVAAANGQSRVAEGDELDEVGEEAPAATKKRK